MSGVPPRTKRVLLITRNFPPLVGGMERLNWHLARQLAVDFEVQVIAPVGAAASAPANVRIHEVPLKPLWLFILSATVRAAALSLRWKPDFVLAGSGLTAPSGWLAARICRGKAVAYVHGLDVAIQHWAYRRIWTPFLRRLDRVIANSRVTAQLAMEVGILESRIGIVHPGVDLPSPVSRNRWMQFRERHALGDGPLLLSVGRLTERKGLREFVNSVFPEIVAAHASAKLLVIGGEPENSLYAKGQSVESIRAVAVARGVAGALHFAGVITDTEELSNAYSAADIHVFPVKDIPGDPEGFGMVAIEAAAHGLPTVAYASGGVVDAVLDGCSGLLVAPGDAEGLRDSILQLLREPLATEQVRTFAQQFDWICFQTKIVAELRRA